MQLLVILQEQSCPKGYAVSTSAVQNAKKRCVTTKRSLCASSTDLVTPQGRVSSPPFTPSICLKYSLSVFSQTFHFFFASLFPAFSLSTGRFLSRPLFPKFLFVYSILLDFVSFHFGFLCFFPFHFLSLHSLCYFPSLRFTFTVLKSFLLGVCSTDLVQIPMINRVHSSE